MNQNRQPAGQPTGGQYAEEGRAPSGVSLDPAGAETDPRPDAQVMRRVAEMDRKIARYRKERAESRHALLRGRNPFVARRDAADTRSELADDCVRHLSHVLSSLPTPDNPEDAARLEAVRKRLNAANLAYTNWTQASSRGRDTYAAWVAHRHATDSMADELIEDAAWMNEALKSGHNNPPAEPQESPTGWVGIHTV